LLAGGRASHRRRQRTVTRLDLGEGIMSTRAIRGGPLAQSWKRYSEFLVGAALPRRPAERIMLKIRPVSLTVALALAGLAACQSPPVPSRVVSTQGAPLGTVETPTGCGTDDGGFGADVRHFGDPTPWSDNPFLNPCWPN